MKVSNKFNFDIFINEFNENYNKYSIKNIDTDEKKEFLYNIVNAYYFFNSLNSLDILFNEEVSEKLKSLEIEKNIFIIKYNLLKFNLWASLDEEIKNFYFLLFNFYVKYFSVINLKNFDSNLFNKINDKYYYNDEEIENDKPFLYLEIENDFIYYYFHDGFLYSKCINKINYGILNLIDDAIYDFSNFKYKNQYEIFKYINKIIEFDKKFKELQ